MTAAWNAWQRFWFARQGVAPLILFRTAYGAIVFLWAVSVLPDAVTFFGDTGVVPDGPHRAGAWGLLDLWNSDGLAVALVVLLALAGLALALGFWPRVAAAVVFACFLSVSKRDPFIGNSGDALLRTMSLYLVVAPGLAGPFTARAPVWGLRLIQVQISMLYVSTVWAKLRGDLWPAGKATAYALRLEDLSRFPLPDLGQWLVVTNIATFTVLVIEASLGVLVWKRVLRPYVLIAGVCLHLGIEYRLRVGFFSWAIIASYLAFIPADTAARFVQFLRPKWKRPA